MGLVDMHRVRAYWENGSRVAEVMSRKRFEKKKIASNLHFADDTVTEDVKEDKCWKIRPWLSALRNNMQRIPEEKKSGVDESLVPFRGRCHIWQYMPNKHNSKWGLKLWA